MSNPAAAIRDWFRTGPDRPRLALPRERERRIFEAHRWSVFLSVTIGYGVFYVGRINFGVAKKPMLDEGVLDATQMGVIGSALLIAYAAGKALNGFLADRANVARFMPTALLVLALLNAACGFGPGFLAFAGLWAMNGLFQSAGAPSSIVALSHWFGPRERGSRYGIWCISHNLGEVFTYAFTAALVSATSWRAGFFGPALVCGLGAIILFRTLSDRPQTLGLPPVTEYRRDPAPTEQPGKSVGGLQIEVLRNPAVWVLGCASALMYVSRYGVNNWGILYLQEGKGHPLMDAGAIMSLYAGAGLAGSFFSGIISDRFFDSRRSLLCFLAGLAQVASLVALHVIPRGHPALDAITLVVFGFAMGILVSFLGGLMAIDIVSPRAAGAASGVVGLFSYIGAAVQDAVSGILIDQARNGANTLAKAHPDFGPLLSFWIGASVLSLLLPLTVWRRVERARAGRFAGP